MPLPRVVKKSGESRSWPPIREALVGISFRDELPSGRILIVQEQIPQEDLGKMIARRIMRGIV
jgi:hypothetical protein